MAGTLSPNVRPFMFDNRVFDNPVVAEKPQPKYTEGDLAAAKATAFAEGREAGRRAENDSQTKKACDLLVHLLASSAKIEQETAAQQENLLGDAGELARRILGKLMPTATARGALAEIEAVIGEAIAEQHSAPRLSIHVSQDMLPVVSGLAETLRTQDGFDGKLAFIADSALGNSDCRIEWATGGAERILDKIWNDIDTCISQKSLQGDPS